MRFVGVDVGKDAHVVAMVDESQAVLVRPTPIEADASGHAKLLDLLGRPDDTIVAMEATGHYWQNLFACLTSKGFSIALLNPLRTRRFAEEDLVRAKSDAIDALAIARFAAQKRPAVTRLSDEATTELRELVRLRDRWVQELSDHVRQLHRLVDLGFPEFTRHVKTLDSSLATEILAVYPTAAALKRARVGELANLCYDGRHTVGRALANALIDSAKTSVGAHHSAVYQLQIRTLCEDITTLRTRLRRIEGEIDRTLDQHEVGKLLTTIDGIGPHTAARIIAEVGDPAAYRDASALAAYVGVVPATSHSGKRRPLRAPISNLGNARLRRALWMPTLTAVKRNAWLRAFYEGLRARGKVGKVALVAAMRKLLAAIYSVAKNRKPFVPRLPAPAGGLRPINA
jgi:transposase